MDFLRINLSLSTEIYPLECIMATAYALLDKGWFLIEPAQSGTVVLRFSAKQGEEGDETLRESVLAVLCNESLRLNMAQRTASSREKVLNEAIGLALGRDSGGDSNWEDDPLGIALPWEDKFGAGKDL